MLVDRKPRVVTLALISFALMLSSVQSISTAHATTLTCAQGGVCSVGDTGPGGGIVFYVAADQNSFACGPTLAQMCTYLENARADDLNAPPTPWSVDSLKGTTVVFGARNVSIGKGYKNTLNIIAQQGPYNALTNNYLAGVAQAFRGGGKTDWYLPSTDELYQLHLSRIRTDTFAQSSTETSPSKSSGIYLVDRNALVVTEVQKFDLNRVVAIRAFARGISGTYVCGSGSYEVFQGVVLSQSNCTGEVTIPEGVWAIKDAAFGDSQITKINFSTTLTTIGNSAFSGNALLETITIPDGVTKLGTFAFFGASSVTSVSIGAGLIELRDYSFHDLTSLVNLTIPSTVRTIYPGAFGGATNLVNLTILNGVTTILDSAFYGANSLTSLIIPSSVSELGNASFGTRSSSLRSVQILSASITGPDDDPVFNGLSSLTTLNCLTNLSNLDRVTDLGLPDVPACDTSSVPDAPVISTLVGGDRQLRITFTIASDGGEAIDLIQYSSDSGATWVGASGTTSPITISSLTGRTSYTVQIRAHNSVGNSSGSNLKTAATTDSSVDASEAAAAEAARVAAAEAARVAAVNAAVAAAAAKRAAEQKEMSELLSVIPSIAGLALNLGDLTNSLLVKQKCVNGKTTKLVKKGAKCPKGYVKRK
jgi:hypothetical protein